VLQRLELPDLLAEGLPLVEVGQRVLEDAVDDPAAQGSPRTRSSGTKTSSRKISQEPTARIPSFGICRVSTPLALPGTRNRVVPWLFFVTFASDRASSRK